jgi:hypothetical protein
VLSAVGLPTDLVVVLGLCLAPATEHKHLVALLAARVAHSLPHSPLDSQSPQSGATIAASMTRQTMTGQII